MIEINSTLHTSTDKITKYNAEFILDKHGGSIKSLTALSEKKKYKLNCNISYNTIYIQEKYFHLFFDYSPIVENFDTFEDFNIKRLFFELSFIDKLKKLSEAIRKNKIMYNTNSSFVVYIIIRNVLRLSSK